MRGGACTEDVGQSPRPSCAPPDYKLCQADGVKPDDIVRRLIESTPVEK